MDEIFQHAVVKTVANKTVEYLNSEHFRFLYLEQIENCRGTILDSISYLNVFDFLFEDLKVELYEILPISDTSEKKYSFLFNMVESLEGLLELLFLRPICDANNADQMHPVCLFTCKGFYFSLLIENIISRLRFSDRIVKQSISSDSNTFRINYSTTKFYDLYFS